MLVRFTSIVATIGLIATSVHASGQIAQVIDATNFCVFLPPSDSTNRIIADTEWNANAFCLGNTPKATGAEKLPSGFIKSAHFVKTDAYVQVTGQMDYTKANLVGTDEGGQMDVRAPMGSSCAGWTYYVNLIEPVSNTYCMRCCNDPKTCNRGISEKGCAHIIPGDYSGPNGSPTTATAAITTTTTTTATTLTTAPGTAVSSSAISSSSLVASSSSIASSSAVSPTVAAATTASPTTSPTTTDGTVSEQSVNAAGVNKPLSLAVAAGILISAIIA